jgi:hypothetical protein
MFGHVVRYRVRYYWVMRPGYTVKGKKAHLLHYHPKWELRADAVDYLAPRIPILPVVPPQRIRYSYEHQTGYDLGSVRTIVGGYCVYMVRHDHNPNHTAFMAVVSYRRDFGKRHRIHIRVRTMAGRRNRYRGILRPTVSPRRSRKRAQPRGDETSTP